MSDYGVVVAIERMTSEIAKLSNKKIIFECDGKTKVVLSLLEETNIYRVTQEAINNALKYAEASYVLVRIIIGYEMLSILVEDDGKGLIFLRSKNRKKWERVWVVFYGGACSLY